MLKQFIEKKEKILSKINKTKSCWIWTGYINPHGYGQVYWKGKGFKAHRVVYELYGNIIPIGMEIDHLCRNRVCVNPNHLEAVTKLTNILRGFGISAINARKKKCPKCGGGYSFRTNGYRRCQKCYLEYMKAYHIKNPEA